MSSTSTPEQRLFTMLGGQTTITIGTAESCTGGFVAGRISSIAGASAYFTGSVISYAYSVKESLLGIPRTVLDNPGAVSELCARLMAEGVRDRLDTTFAVSTTGIAGPTGATKRKPVGLVYIAVAGPDGTDVEEHVFPGDRAAITAAATECALDALAHAVTAYLDGTERSAAVR